jgi:hypothetical protein
LIRDTGRVPAYQKDAKIRVFRDFCLSLLPTIGERFGEWFEALLAKRVGRSKKNFLFLFYALRKLFPNKY